MIKQITVDGDGCGNDDGKGHGNISDGWNL